MKKVVKLFLITLLTFGFSFSKVNAAETLADLKAELRKAQAEYNAANAGKQKTESEINNQKNNIANAYNAIEQAESDIALAKQNIEKSSEEIAKTKEEIEQLLVFYEISQGENDFLQYISGSSSMTDLMMRIEAVSQVLSYSQNKLNEMEELITENEKLQIDLAKKQVELEGKIVTYQDSIEVLKSDLSSLVQLSASALDEINSKKELIASYERAGCKDNDLLATCINVNDTLQWMKPTSKGYISSGFGWRSFYLNGVLRNEFHNAVDVAGAGARAPLYAVANGYVAAIWWKQEYGGNQVFLHVKVQGKKYTVRYAHMYDVNVKVGDKVTQSTVIGTMGGGGATLYKNGGWDKGSTGWHLHLEVANGWYLEDYTSYSKYVANCITPPMMPSYGKWYYSR
ncbi:MAG: peptidoglycan DD-metalloendopeptidase family protein [Bacilli bacterium]|nr:peptidoglycan DD-metalloendopeptidase family protein [Bacilli bacterium]